MAEFIVVHSIKVATDFTPETFGRLTTVGPRFRLPVGNKNRGCYFIVCKCECGEYTLCRTDSLNSGLTESCGCLHKEVVVTIGNANKKHGMSLSVEYKTHKSIKYRCLNDEAPNYIDYGGRGITVCARWLDPENGFASFLADMGPRPSPEHSIDRIDVNGNYCPENCRWATVKEQARNTRRTLNWTHDGKTQCVAAWAEELGVSVCKIRKLMRDV